MPDKKLVGTSYKGEDSSKQYAIKLELEEAFNAIGETMLSDDKCCQLMAWLYLFGGGQEVTTQNNNLIADIKIAQKRLNIFGGEIPNVKLLGLFQDYCEEAKRFNGKNLPWLQEIMSHYKGIHKVSEPEVNFSSSGDGQVKLGL